MMFSIEGEGEGRSSVPGTAVCQISAERGDLQCLETEPAKRVSLPGVKTQLEAERRLTVATHSQEAGPYGKSLGSPATVRVPA